MVFTGPYPDVAIPEVSLGEYLFADVASRADRPALIDGVSGQEITYGQLNHLTDRVAAALAERGIGKGDVVAIFAPNTPYWAVVNIVQIPKSAAGKILRKDLRAKEAAGSQSSRAGSR